MIEHVHADAVAPASSTVGGLGVGARAGSIAPASYSDIGRAPISSASISRIADCVIAVRPRCLHPNQSLTFDTAEAGTEFKREQGIDRAGHLPAIPLADHLRRRVQAERSARVTEGQIDLQDVNIALQYLASIGYVEATNLVGETVDLWGNTGCTGDLNQWPIRQARYQRLIIKKQSACAW